MEYLFLPNTWMILVFLFGYLFITLEHRTGVNKAAIALLTGVLCWVIQFLGNPSENSLSLFCHHLSDSMQVILFLIGALTIVEMISSHGAFRLVGNMIRIRSKRKLLWFLGFVTFFLSAILDNLTTTIVMITLLQRIFPEDKDRILFGGGVVIAANAGGAWTPIGDVTTTMLWIGGQLTTETIVASLILPSLFCLILSLGVLTFSLQGTCQIEEKKRVEVEPLGRFVFFLGIGCLIGVPFFKMVTGLPPFMAILFGLGIMWLVTDLAHAEVEERTHLRVPYVMSKVDMSSPLFFLGILLAIDALSQAGILFELAESIRTLFVHPEWVAILIGLASSIVDNVPLVAATMNMYPLTTFPTNDGFWAMVAFCAGTGGSILLIGSAAGVAFMGLENVSFFWYFRRISFAAALGFAGGAALYLLLGFVRV